MTKVTFDEVSGGTVSSTPDAFSVTNTGSGPALRGESTGGFTGIFGISQHNGIFGETASANNNDSGVVGKNDAGGNGVAGSSKDGFGIRGDSTNGFAAVHGHGGKNGMWGFTISATDSGVFGQNDGAGVGAAGFSKDGFGIRGDSTNGFAAVHGHGGKNGVWGFTISATDSGVFGQNDGSGVGVAGSSKAGDGTRGDTHASAKNGVVGTNDSVDPVPAGQPGGNGVFGFSKNPNASGVFGANDVGFGIAGFSQNNIGVLGRGKIAGRFEGNVEVTGNINANDFFIGGGDCAEDFDIAGAAEQNDPGTVMVIDPEGALQQSQQAYDKRVAGVISGAGDLKPGIVLDKRQSQGNRMPIALLGKVNCKVDARYSSIEVGDLLTTSPTPGFAMKASEPGKAFGAVIGKALRPMETGQGLIPILIALQ
jgi:hypothetical protein